MNHIDLVAKPHGLDSMKPLLRLLSILALSCAHAHAESVPALINYQGHLTDAQGRALPTADYALSFSIYDASLAGNVVWGPQTFDGVNGTGRSSKVPVVDGWFNVMLGPEDIQGRSLATAFTSTNRWVEIQVGSAQPIQPRQRILSAPFALLAENAANLMVGGTRAIGYSPGKNGLFINQQEYWPSTYFGGQVGIGNFDAGNILATEALLHVLDDNPVVKIQQNPGLPGGASLVLGAAGSGTNKVRIVMHGITLESASGGSGDYLNVHNGRVGTIAHFGSDGFVGIGTVAPATRLHVNGGNLDGILRLETSGPGKAPAIQFNNTIGNPLLHTIGQETSLGSGLLTGSTARALVISAQGANPIQFGVDDRVAVTIANGGSVGIGTTTPQAPLDVIGTVKAEYLSLRSRPASIEGGELSLEGPGTNGSWQLDAYTNSFRVHSEGTTKLVIKSNGNIGMGDNSPAERLVVAGNVVASGTIRGSSDRNRKADISPASIRSILDKLERLPIYEWRFHSELKGVRHVGPMAQDFRAAFGLGQDDTTIAMVDADGVALAAIQGLMQVLHDKETRIQELEQRLATLEDSMGELARVTRQAFQETK